MKRTFARVAGVASLAAVFAAPLAEANPRAILSAVNYDREMAGIKPLTADPGLTAGCSAHARYMEGAGALSHSEAPGSPLFSDEGLWAGNHAVLARSSAGFSGNPWRSAPLHQFQVLHPWLGKTGVGETGGFACMVTLGDRDAPNPSEIGLVTAPGTGQYVRPAEVARESPFVPGDEVGLPQGTKTGPHIYVYAVGPQRFGSVTINAASLTAADDGSQVEVRWVDGASPRSGSYLDGGAILIPATPLKEGTTYGLRVEAATTSATGSRLQISRTSSFITGPDESDLALSPTTTETVTAASARPVATTKKKAPKKLKKGAPAILGAEGAPKLAVSLRWNETGVRARITCLSTVSRCEGPLRVLVRKKGRKVQKLRFVARGGPLKLSLAPGKSINRRIIMQGAQIKSGKKRGFAIRWGSPGIEKARALEVQ